MNNGCQFCGNPIENEQDEYPITDKETLVEVTICGGCYNQDGGVK